MRTPMKLSTRMLYATAAVMTLCCAVTLAYNFSQNPSINAERAIWLVFLAFGLFRLWELRKEMRKS